MTGSEPPLRIMFVFAHLEEGEDEAEAMLLARQLDPQRYRIEAVVCFESPDAQPKADPLREAGIELDTCPYDLPFEATVQYLAEKLALHDIVVSFQNVADVYPALERMHWRPILIERGRSVAHARAGPKHFTTRYAASTPAVREAAADTLGDRADHALLLSFMPGSRKRCSLALADKWRRLFDVVLDERRPAPAPSIFSSFIQAGFECSTHRRKDGTRLDLIAATGHDLHAARDYAQLAELGITTMRDGLRWHLIERTPGQFNWSSLAPMVQAAAQSGVQIIWDLMHFGWPDDLDIWQPAFVDRFARFARGAAKFMRSQSGAGTFYCPVNEISFHAWAGGDVGHFNPFARGRGFELKVQLARAAVAGMREIRAVDPAARFMACEPVIHVAGAEGDRATRQRAHSVRGFQFQAFDMISGRAWPQLGGSPEFLDVVGVNYYRHNQSVLDGEFIGPAHPGHIPLRYLLADVHARYGRPICVSETGADDDLRASWFSYVVTEVEAARRAGIPVEGVCLYPIIDHNDWDDDHVRLSGLLAHRTDGVLRQANPPLAAAVAAAISSGKLLRP